MTPTHPAADGYRHNVKLAVDYHRHLINDNRAGHHAYSHHIIESHQEFQLATGYQTLLQLALEELARSATALGNNITPADVFDALTAHADRLLTRPELDTEVAFLEMTDRLQNEPPADDAG